MEIRKILSIVFGVVLLCGCTRDGNESISWCVRIINNTDCTLTFSNIDCEGPNKGYGDYTFYPEKSFTIEPHGEYKQQLDDEWMYQGHLVSPYSMDVECDGKTRHFDSEDRSIFENPCNHDYWYYQNATGREPAMSIHIITNEHIDKWFGE